MANEPAEFISGDTVEWTETLGDYPAGGIYSAAYILNGPTKTTINGTADGTDWDFALTPTQSAAIGFGVYSWALVITWTDNRVTLRTGRLQVTPNPATSTVTDQRQHAEYMLEALEAVLRGKVTDDIVQASIGGRQIIKMRPQELEKWRGIYRSEVDRLRHDEKREQGLASSYLARHQNLGARYR